MDVVDDDEQRRALREPDEQPVEPVERREVGVGRRAGVGLGEERQRVRRATLEQRRTLGLGERGERRLEQLPDGAEREVALELRAAGAQHLQPALLDDLAHGGEQTRLADPGRPLDQHEAAAPGGGGVDERAQRLQLVLPVDESLQRHARPSAVVVARL